MSGGELRARLEAVLGPSGVVALSGVSLEGARPAFALRPASGEELAALLPVLAEAGAPALVRGGGTRLGLGHPVPTARVVIDTTALAAAPIVDAEDGVAYLPAGQALSESCEHVHKVGEGRWELPIDGAAPASTLGGALATAAVGPRGGAPRDAVLGLDVTLASGERTRCGGRVVKNVTGYDLAKLYIGSLGGLGVIEAAWLRLRPAPERRALVAAELPASALAADGPAIRAARRASVAAAGWSSPEPAPGAAPRAGTLCIELAGDAAAVDADEAALRAELGAAPVPLDEAGSNPWWRPTPETGLDFRVSCVASGIAPAAERLLAASARVDVDLRHGLVWAQAEPASEQATEAVFAAVGESARDGGGDWRLESGPAAVRAAYEVFGEASGHPELVRALKLQYDPHGLLNPGRQAGRT